MFAAFFYLLRARGLAVSLNEWLTLLQGMEQGLHGSTLTGFYFLCRAIVVKSEAEYDRFDQAFAEFFKDVPHKGELPEEVLEWLNHPLEDLKRSLEELKQRQAIFEDKSLEELLELLERRLKQQDEQHNGGSYWIGTQGRSPLGNSGWNPGGLRIGGKSQYRTAMLVAEDRKFRDFRKDNTLDIRQFQMAFRLLRQFSAQMMDAQRELDVEGTVRDTGDNAGMLRVRYRPPRRNTVKVLLLMDSGGSMEYYAGLCSMLFQAATRSNHFKELHTYYFHNCIFSNLYTDPTLSWDSMVPTEWVLNNFGSEYKVIIVGDAAMHPSELRTPHYDWVAGSLSPSGLEWMDRLKHQYPYLIWLNPEPLPRASDFWGQTHLELAQMVPMFDLSMEGLEHGMKRLMVRR